MLVYTKAHAENLPVCCFEVSLPLFLKDGLFLNNLSNDIRIQRKSPEDVDNGECFVFCELFMHWISLSLKRIFSLLFPHCSARSPSHHYLGIFLFFFVQQKQQQVEKVSFRFLTK